MKRIRKQRVIAFMLVFVMLFTTGCSSGFYADELSSVDSSVSGNNSEADIEESQNPNEGIIDTSESVILVDSDSISEEVTDSLPSDDNESDTDSGYFDKNGQYHFDPESEESVQKWMDLYTPNRTGDDFLNLSEDWWNNLTPDELDFAKFATYEVEPNPNEYYEQTLDECIEIISNGVEADEFFLGTIFEGISLEDLFLLKENNYSLDDLADEISSLAFTDGVLDENKILSESTETSNSILTTIAKNASATKVKSVSKKSKVQARAAAGALDSIELKPYVRSTGYFGDKHGEIWWIDIGSGANSAPALCMDYGNTCRNHYTYENHAEMESKVLGYFAWKADTSSARTRVGVQIAFWLYLGAWGTGGLNYSKAVVGGMVDMMLSKKGNAQAEADRDAIKAIAWSTYNGAKNNGKLYNYYIWYCNVGGSQRLITYKRPPVYIDPEITTKALTSDGQKNIDKTLNPTLTSITINDTISYMDCDDYIGKSCTLKGWVVINSESNIAPGTVQEMPVSISKESGTWTMSFNVDISALNDGDKLVVFEELYDDKGKLICSHKKLSDDKQTINIGSTPPPDTEESTGDITESYHCETTLTTTVNVNKRDIETDKTLQGVTFDFSDGYSSTQVTDSNGNCSDTNSDLLFADASWSVSTRDESTTTTDASGNTTTKHKYTYTCGSCGTSEFSSSGERDSAGHAHCLQHATQLAEADLDAQVAAYTFSWTVTETAPRTSNHSSALVTGGSDSYTTGYHNNPVITKSNTETGYQKGGLTSASTPNFGHHAGTVRNIPLPLTNERVRGTITINKSDMDYLNCRTEGDNNQDFIPQGDASLAGAVYGLYANADIIRPDGKSGDRTGLPTNTRMD